MKKQLYEKTHIGEFLGCLVCLGSQQPTGKLVKMVLVVYCSIADLHHFDADLDPFFHLIADPD